MKIRLKPLLIGAIENFKCKAEHAYDYTYSTSF